MLKRRHRLRIESDIKPLEHPLQKIGLLRFGKHMDELLQLQLPRHMHITADMIGPTEHDRLAQLKHGGI